MKMMTGTLNKFAWVGLSVLGLSVGLGAHGLAHNPQMPHTVIETATTAPRVLAQASQPATSAYTYEQAMTNGYAATEARDYQTALINFRRALASRPGDTRATTAIQNVERYIYEQAMAIGYGATEARDYQTALINFRRALANRPGDIYATTAIRNVERYILEAQLSQSVAQKDWICAAQTVDLLITQVPTNSLERSRLVSYRGELTRLIENQVNLENWSSVCPG